MKKRHLIVLSMFLIVLSCGSSEKVIMNDGTVYRVEGKNFYKKGKEVTESLSNTDKEKILNTLNERLEFEKEAQKRQKELEARREALKKAQEQAQATQKALEEALEEKEEAREAFFEAKEKLEKQQKKYKRLHDNGKLSPNDEEKWDLKLKDLEQKLEEAKNKVKNL